jgi:hypothetical protein
MTCCQLIAGDAKTGHYKAIWHPEQRNAYLTEIVAEQLEGLCG